MLFLSDRLIHAHTYMLALIVEGSTIEMLCGGCMHIQHHNTCAIALVVLATFSISIAFLTLSCCSAVLICRLHQGVPYSPLINDHYSMRALANLAVRGWLAWLPKQLDLPPPRTYAARSPSDPWRALPPAARITGTS